MLKAFRQQNLLKFSWDLRAAEQSPLIVGKQYALRVTRGARFAPLIKPVHAVHFSTLGVGLPKLAIGEALSSSGHMSAPALPFHPSTFQDIIAKGNRLIPCRSFTSLWE